MGETLFDKLWDSHVVVQKEHVALLYVDRHLLHEGSIDAFNNLRRTGRRVRRPSQTLAMADHYVPTRNRGAGIEGIADVEIRELVRAVHANTSEHGIELFGLDSPEQGIVHVVGPEQGLSQPGLTVLCGDSHTSTHGAFGGLAFGVGASEVTHVLETQTIWQRKPRSMRVSIGGSRPLGITAKDIALAVTSEIGAAGGVGHAIEFAGDVVRAMTMEERMTLCNMAIEVGARCGLVGPDDTTFEYLHGRRFAPSGPMWDQALAWWKTLPSDPLARFDREVTLDISELAPSVTWGTSPSDVVSIAGVVPDPAREVDPGRRAHIERALEYMDLRPNARLEGLEIDWVFIGSCTNGRIEDLRAAASVVRGREVRTPGMVVPGSGPVKRQAEAEGLDRIFVEAGLQWRDSACSMCLGVNGDTLEPGMRCASTSNRNFEGRQGKGVRTHLVSPAMAAAAALAGCLTDVRPYLERG